MGEIAIPPKLPQSIYEAFAAAEIYPTAVIVLMEGVDEEGRLNHELFEVEGHTFDRGDIPVAGLHLPEVTIQRIGCSVVCTKYGCVKVPCT